MLRPFFPELVMSTDLLSFEHPSVLLFCLEIGSQEKIWLPFPVVYNCYMLALKRVMICYLPTAFKVTLLHRFGSSLRTGDDMLFEHRFQRNITS